MGAQIFLHNLLQRFYANTRIGGVPEISGREFGIGEFGKKISSRHLSFCSADALNAFLREKAPFYISCSAARYSLPVARPMDAKGLIGADLIYEFDADEIMTSCKTSHDSWKCSSCGAGGKGRLLECPQCGRGAQVEEWVCPECLGETKRLTLRLIKVMERDFGFSQGLSVNFSGSKGFHVHVRSDAVQGFSKAGRLELLDYITGTNLSLAPLGFSFPRGSGLCPKRGAAKGWARVLLEGVEEAFSQNDAGALAVMANVPYRNAEKLLKEKRAIMNGMERGILLGMNGIRAEKIWKPLLLSVADLQKLPVDRQTSTDIYKIIRVPDTIHGSTGLQAKTVSLQELSSFDPLKECVVMGGEEVLVKNALAPRFYLNGKWFGPYNNDSLSLPEYAAFYLLARHSAEVA